MSAIFLALASVALWSSVALLNTQMVAIPPLFMVSVSLVLGGIVGLSRLREWGVPLKTFAIGLGGIFGYHALLFTAMRMAPVVEVSLINYLWPLLIVLLSPLIVKGTKLRPWHVGGAFLGLAGAALIVTGGRLSLDMAALPGYLLAIGAAFTWAIYSLFTKRLPPFPTGAVGGFCLASGLFAFGLHALERAAARAPIMPALTGREWLFLVLMGIGPLGCAFYTWDAAMKRGDPRIIGALSYLTPMLSILNLVLFGGKKLSGIAGAAMGLIVAGAFLGSLDLFRPKRELPGRKASPRL
jgi:drug/metabolite transporter (DMT)-like permease